MSFPRVSFPKTPFGQEIAAAAEQWKREYYGTFGKSEGRVYTAGVVVAEGEDADSERFDPANGVFANPPSVLRMNDLNAIMNSVPSAYQQKAKQTIEQLYRHDPVKNTLVLRNDPKKRAEIDLAAAEAAEAKRIRDHEHEVMTRKYDPLPASWARNGSARACWDRKWRPGSG